jgi:uncharacterized protein DUF2183
MALAAFVSLGTGLGVAALAAPISSDETVWFFPTVGAQQPDGSWELPVHAWVFELEGGLASGGGEADLSTERVQDSVDRLLDSTDLGGRAGAFNERIRFFTPLLDNERGKEIELTIDDTVVELAPTRANGHVLDTVPYRGAAAPGSWLAFASTHPSGTTIEGAVQLVPPRGRSVISDIDDTIKISEVLDKRALLANTFVHPYRPVEGMPELYSGALRGRYFHYVSASPWRLYPALAPFLAQFPRGAIYLRHFRIQDGSFLEFLESSEDYKVDTIRGIFERYPGHTFTLIGDSGEHDPAVYAQIYAAYPAQVEAILIRNVVGSAWTEARFRTTFPDIPDDRWEFFDRPEGLAVP